MTSSSLPPEPPGQDRPDAQQRLTSEHGYLVGAAVILAVAVVLFLVEQATPVQVSKGAHAILAGLFAVAAQGYIVRSEGARVRRKDDGRQFQAGYKAGHRVGCYEGHVAGRKVGYDEGRATGHRAGYDEGRATGQRAGYDDGHAAGHKVGYDDGHAAGHKVGYDDGRADGFVEGAAGASSLRSVQPIHHRRPTS